jgi:ABC-2 type transport system ATP-binding protein
VIRLRGLGVKFARPILEGVDLHITPGEHIAIVGLNGAGKTTLFRSLLGLTRYRGSITVRGMEVQDQLREVRRVIGYVPQRPPVFDGTLNAFLHFVARIRGIDPTRLEVMMGHLGLSLEKHGRTAFNRMSGGMIQKTLVGAALASEPLVLMLDEPTANLDSRTRHDLLERISFLSRDTTVLLSSHRMDDVQAIAHRMAILHHGRMVHDGPTSALGDHVSPIATLRLDIPASRYDDAANAIADLVSSPSRNGAFTFSVAEADAGRTIQRIHDIGIDVGRIDIDRPSLDERLNKFLEVLND